jgi:hypothetical protein
MESCGFAAFATRGATERGSLDIGNRGASVPAEGLQGIFRESI